MIRVTYSGSSSGRHCTRSSILVSSAWHRTQLHGLFYRKVINPAGKSVLLRPLTPPMRRRNMIRQQHCTAQNGQPAPGPVFPPLLSVFRLFQQELMRFQIPVPQVATQTKISNQHPAGIRDTHQIFITERIFTVPEAWRIKSRTPIIAISTPANSHRVSEGADEAAPWSMLLFVPSPFLSYRAFRRAGNHRQPH